MTSPVFVELKAISGEFMAKMGAARAEISHLGTGSAAHLQKLQTVGKAALTGIAVGAGVVGVAAVKMAGDFQESMTSLVTGAGESQKNIKLVSDGILKMAGQVGTSAQDLAKGMYMVESAGFHGADGLRVLEAAAKGAKVGAADMASVSNAVTSALNAYQLSGKSAATVTNTLIATVATGKMHMDDLAHSLGTVLPSAAALHVTLPEVGAAIATMTSQGTNASQAATYLRFTLAALVNPTAKARDQMKALGLSSTDVANEMRDHGLPAALKMLTDAAGKHFPAGSTKYTRALANMVGGTRGMQSMLELTGPHMTKFINNTVAINDKANKSRGSISGWAKVQEDFNQKLARAKATVEALAIRLGTVLIPYVEKAAAAVAKVVEWLGKHRTVAIALGTAIGGVLVVAIGVYIVSMAAAAVATIAATWPLILIVAAVAALAAGLVYAWQHSEKFRVVVTAVGHAVKAAVVSSIGWITNSALPALKGAWHATFGAIGAVIRAFGAPLQWIRSQISLFTGFWRDHGQQLRQIWHVVWTAITTVLRVEWAVISTVVRTGWRVIMDVLRPGLTVLKALFKTTWDAIRLIVGTAVKLVGDVLHTGMQIFLDIAGVILDLLTGKWGKAWKDIKKLVHDAIHGVLQLLRDWSLGAIRLLYQVGKDLIMGLVHGIEAMAKAPWNAVKHIGHGIVSGAKKIFHIFSPSRVFAEIGANLMEGLALGITATAHKATEAMTAATEKVTAAGRKVLAGIAAAVAPDATFGQLLKAYPHTRTHALHAAQTAAITTAHAKELAEHVDALAAKLKRKKDADTAALDAARRHSTHIGEQAHKAHRTAQALADQATQATRAAAAMASKTKAEKAAKAAAEAHVKTLRDQAHAALEHARNLDDEARSARTSATALADKYDRQHKALQGTVDAAKKASAAAKAAADKASQAAKDAAQKAQEAAKSLVDAISGAADQLIAKISDFRSAIASGIAGDTSLSSLWNNMGDAASLNGLQANLDQVLTGAEQFAGDLQALAAAGAGQDLITQIAGMGPVAGDQLARQLLAAGTGTITHLQDTLAQIASVADSAGLALAHTFYDQGAGALEQFIAGLEQRFPELKKALDAIAAQVAAAFGGPVGTVAGASQPGTGLGGPLLIRGQGPAATGLGGGDLTIHVPLIIDGREFATATRTYTRDALLKDAAATKSSLWGAHA